MIFRPELAKKIRAGEKTQTRRPIKPGQDACRYEPGKAYAVQPGRGKEGVCRITVLDVRRERVGAISFQDAKREGFKTRQEFWDYWQALYGGSDQGCWPRLAHQQVWVITFALGDLTDSRRMLTRAGGRTVYRRLRPVAPGARGRWVVAEGGDDQDYTTEPRDPLQAGEAVTAHEQHLLTVRARARDDKRALDQREESARQPLASRLEAIDGVRIRRRIDVTRELRVIEERVRRAEKALELGGCSIPSDAARILTATTQPMRPDTDGG